MIINSPFEIGEKVFITKRIEGLIIQCNIEYIDLLVTKENHIQWHVSTSYREKDGDVQYRIPAEQCFKTVEEAINSLRTFTPEIITQ